MKGLLLGLLLLASCSVFNRQPGDFYESMGKVRIIQGSTGVVVGNGTAFVVADQILLTAGHVCKVITDRRFTSDLEYFYNGGFRKAAITAVLKTDAVNDLCLIRVGIGARLRPFKIARSESMIGDPVYSYGCADGVFGFLSNGFLVDNSALDGNRKVLVVSAAAFFGQSGGPILNEDGEVIGLVSGGSGEFHHIQVSPPTAVIREFVKGYVK